MTGNHWYVSGIHVGIDLLVMILLGLPVVAIELVTPTETRTIAARVVVATRFLIGLSPTQLPFGG